MRCKFRILGSFLFVLISVNLISQTPKDDLSFQADFEDNFSTLELTSNWRIRDKDVCECNTQPTWYVNDSRNLSVEYSAEIGSDILKIWFEEDNSSSDCDDCNPQHGQLYRTSSIANRTPFLYGYFEIYCKFPDIDLARPAFWLFSRGIPHYEIDFFEYESYNHGPHILPFNVHNWDSNPEFHHQTDIWTNHDLRNSFHKYGFHWQPGKIDIYVDDELKYTEVTSQISNNEMDLIIGMVLYMDDLTYESLLPDCDLGECFPWQIDYVKVYSLDMSLSNIPYTYSNLDFRNYDHKVKKSISISNSIVNVDKSTMRASDFILLEEDFIVPAGKEFSAIPTIIY